MRGDFSRVTFRPENHFTGVLLQQGRVQLDAEFNEHVAIEAHRDRETTRDVVGPTGAPLDGGGFEVSVASMLRGVAAGEHAWAVGEDGTILLSEGGTKRWAFTDQPDKPARLNAVHLGTDKTGCAVGDRATIMRLDDATWKPEPAANEVTADLHGVHAGTSDAWAVGTAGTVLAWDGSKWTRQAQDADVVETLRDVHFADDVGAAVGDGGTILLTKDRKTWTVQKTPAGAGDLHGVFLADAEHGWAVGEQGTILFYDGDGWTEQELSPRVTATLRGVVMTSTTEGFAVGDRGTALRLQDGSWTETATSVEADLRALAALPSGAPIAVGDDVAIRWTSEGWTAAPDLPASRSGPRGRTLTLSAGDMYVDGVRYENVRITSLDHQPEPLLGPLPDDDGEFGVVLHVQEQLLTATEREDLREVALGGPDSATRTRSVWQASLVELPASAESGDRDCADLAALVPADGPRGLLRARAVPAAVATSECVVPPNGGYRRLENQLYRVEIHAGTKADGGATYTWSRDNGSVIARLEEVGADSTTKTGSARVSHIGRDAAVGFGPKQLVELTDEGRLLRGEPGVLAEIGEIRGTVLILSNLDKAPLTMADFPVNPIVRRWDGRGKVKPGTWVELEDGVFVEFAEGSDPGDAFRSGDHWTIPARTLSGRVEWPESGGVPRFEDRHGPRRHRVPLAVVSRSKGIWKGVRDCRRLFPPLTGLVQLYYVGGDGQEVMPDPTAPASPPQELKLDQQLEVGVSNWRWPVEGATVQFACAPGNGTLNGPTDTTIVVVTGPNGIAACDWHLDAEHLDAETPSQTATATLLDDDGKPMQTPIHFHANLSSANRVAFDPKNCRNLLKAGAKTVQDAVSRLAAQPRMIDVAGDAQEVLPGDTLDEIRVRVENSCGPIAGAKVRFAVTGGGGALAGDTGTSESVEKTTDADGEAGAAWTLGAVAPTQYVEARLLDDGAGGALLPPPPIVMFSANLSRADHVAYTPPRRCPDLEANTVQEALDALCGTPFAAFAHLDGYGTGRMLHSHNVASFSKAGAPRGRYSFVWERPLPTSATVLAFAYPRPWPGGALPLVASLAERRQTGLTVQVSRTEHGSTYGADSFVALAVLGEAPEELPPEPPPPIVVKVDQSLKVDSWSTDLVTADLDRGGLPDVVVASPFGIQVFMNQGDGQFGDPNLVSASNVSRVAVADLSGDGIPDLVCAHWSSNSLTIFHGGGDGTFGDPITVDVGASVYAVTVGSLAEPGRADIAAVGADGKVRILVAKRDGGYEVARELETGVNTYAADVLAAGVGGGSLSDIVVAYQGANQISTLRARGDLNFGAPVVIPVADGPHRLAAGDLTGDGGLDVVVLCQSEAAVMLSGIRGRLAEAGRHFAGYFPNSIAIADVTGDERPDLIVGSNDAVAVLPGTEPGLFGDAVPVFTPFGAGPQRIAAADLNGDGRVDIAATSAQTAMLNILVSD